MQWASLEDTRALEEECTWAERDVPVTLYELLTRTKNNFGSRPAVSYQLTSGPKDKAETLSWNELHQKTTQTANMFRALGVGPNDVVAYILPNATETVCPFWAGLLQGL
jgi:fatty-acyl-CoA synthase/long-chain acyl-CoA synthetase